ncbi:restriction endonuclease subunit S [Gemella sp. zg-570]|uniref:restriction endonuclease subunit S n=1 Tax=Gemella sp. zg-570 TaxID=2840371 RepID=UPI001C0CC5BC|nr:restriction endonuclease subunit S [Gemella sp. zg-570]QWQ38540.1 restriction endonuclease subunit S [Gemella sp. zg-570]
MKRYKKYKQVNLPWLREVPEHWGTEKIKRLFYISKDLSTKENPVILSLARDKVKVRDISNNKGQIAVDYSNYNKVEKGDLLLNPMDLYSGANCNISYIEGVISPAYINLRNKVKLNKKYYDYWFKAQYTSLALQSVGKGVSKDNRWTLTNETLLNYVTLTPPLSEQSQIANFLDWKIGEIDRLVGLEKRKVERLGELYRKILNNIFDNIIGEKKRLKYIFSFGKGLGITKENLGEYGYRCINYGEIHGKLKFSFSSKDKLLKGLSNVEGITITEFANLSKGDFIFADTSEDLIGSGNFTFLEWLESEVYAGYHTIVCKPKIKFNSRFLAYQLESDLWRTQIRKAVNGIKVYSITQQILKQTSVVFPDLSIQENIVSKLDGIQDKLIDMKRCTETQITYLEQLKQSLISDVVTGKMDVREIEIPEKYRRES